MTGKKIELEVGAEITPKSPTEFYHLLILDKSGSMSSVREATLAGINQNIKGINNDAEKFPDQKHFFSLVTFSYHNDIKFVRWLVPNAQNNPLSIEDYMPDGGTALLDAIGLSINKLKSDIQDKLNDGTAVALVTIMTDGEENTSKEFKFEQIESLIKGLQDLPNSPWTITYIGSAPSSKQTAAHMGVKGSNYLGYSADIHGTQCAMDELSSCRSVYTCSVAEGKVKASQSFFNNQDKVANTTSQINTPDTPKTIDTKPKKIKAIKDDNKY